MSPDCCVALSYDATCLSAVCACLVVFPDHTQLTFLMPMLSALGLDCTAVWSAEHDQYNLHHDEPECNLHSYSCDR